MRFQERNVAKYPTPQDEPIEVMNKRLRIRDKRPDEDLITYSQTVMNRDQTTDLTAGQSLISRLIHGFKATRTAMSQWLRSMVGR